MAVPSNWLEPLTEAPARTSELNTLNGAAALTATGEAAKAAPAKIVTTFLILTRASLLAQPKCCSRAVAYPRSGRQYRLPP